MTSQVWELIWIATRHKFEGSGLASALLDHLLDVAAALGVAACVFSARPGCGALVLCYVRVVLVAV